MSIQEDKIKQLTMIIENYIRRKYGICNEYPTVIINIINQFATKILGCSLLANMEDMQLYNILSSKLKSTIKSFEILYKASEHKFSVEKFTELCKNKGPTNNNN